MSKEIIQNGDSTAVVTNKINSNFSELSGSFRIIDENITIQRSKNFDYFTKEEKRFVSTNFGLNLTGSGKWKGSVLAIDGKVYGIPHNATDVLIVDSLNNTATRTTYGLNLPQNLTKWFGGILAKNGKIYSIPYSQTDVLIIDPINRSATLTNFNIDFGGEAKWRGAVLSNYNDIIYGVPWDSTDILVIDPQNNTATRTTFGISIGTGQGKYGGGAVTNGRTYNYTLTSWDNKGIFLKGSYNTADGAPYSYNGLQWIGIGGEPNRNPRNRFQSTTFAFKNNLIVGLNFSYDNTITATSTDGITWVSAANGFGGALAADYSPTLNLFVSLAGRTNSTTQIAPGITSQQTARSTNGTTWTLANNLPSSGFWNDIKWGGTRFVAIAGNNTNKAAHSSNGTTWTSSTLPSNANWQYLTYGTYPVPRFVAVADGAVSAYSDDGVTWQNGGALPQNTSWSVAFGNNRYVAVSNGTDGKFAAYSDNGINWTSVTLPMSARLNSAISNVVFGNGLFVALLGSNDSEEAQYGAQSLGRFIYSYDGINWKIGTATEPGSDYIYLNYTRYANTYVKLHYSGNNILTNIVANDRSNLKGTIFFTPNNATDVLILDTQTAGVLKTNFGLNLTNHRSTGAVTVDGSNVYTAQQDISTLWAEDLFIDANEKTAYFRTRGTQYGVGNNYVLGTNGYVYTINGNYLLRTPTSSITNEGLSEEDLVFAGSPDVFLNITPDGAIVGIPSNTSNIVIIKDELLSGNYPPMEYCISAYNNKT